MILAWTHGDRVWLWRVLAAVVVANLLEVTLSLWAPTHVPSHPSAPAWLLGFAGTRAAVGAVAVLGILGAVASARRDAGVASTLLWLVSIAVLVEADAARGPGPYRGWFFVGAVGLGVVVGRLWARAGGRTALEPAAAELGGLALLAACYLGAATSKLGGAGLGWADATTLRAVALAHALVDSGGLTAWLADSPGVATVLSWATIAIQFGAIGLVVGPRARVAAMLGLVAFHLGVAGFARIGYWSPVVLLLAFGLPWPRWIKAIRTSEDDPAWEVAPRADRWLGAVLVLVLALAWLLPLGEYTAGHHRPRTLDDHGEVAAREPLTEWGPLQVGDPLGEGWQLDAIEREPRRVMLVLHHAEHGRVVLWVSAREAGQGRGSPFDRRELRIAYEGGGLERPFAVAARAVADRLDGDRSVVDTLR